MISDEQLLNFCRALVDTLRSGLSINEAFKILSKSQKYGKFIVTAANMVADGKALHEALKYQKIFPPVFIALVRAGETSGKVDEFLSLFADSLEVRIKFKRRIMRALVYPVFTIILIIGLFLLIAFKVFPLIFEPLFKYGITVPDQIIWMNKMTGYLSVYWLPIIVSILILPLIFRVFISSGLGRKILALSGHCFPGFRFATKEARLYNIYTTMGLLVKAGIPLSAMMDILLQFSQDDIILRRYFSRMSDMVLNGKSFTESFAGFISQEDLSNLEIAEKSGRLDEALLRLSKTHYDRHLHRLKLLVTGFKLASIIVIAILSFALLKALIQPSLSLFKDVQNFPLKTDFVMPSMQEPYRGKVSEERQSPGKAEMYEKTAIFNKIEGGKISDLLKKSSGDSQEEAQDKKKKLSAIAPIKTMQFKKIEPTSINSADIN